MNNARTAKQEHLEILDKLKEIFEKPFISRTKKEQADLEQLLLRVENISDSSTNNSLASLIRNFDNKEKNLSTKVKEAHDTVEALEIYSGSKHF